MPYVKAQTLLIGLFEAAAATSTQGYFVSLSRRKIENYSKAGKFNFTALRFPKCKVQYVKQFQPQETNSSIVYSMQQQLQKSELGCRMTFRNTNSYFPLPILSHFSFHVVQGDVPDTGPAADSSQAQRAIPEKVVFRQ